MAIIATETSFERPKAGKYIGTVIDVVDLGEVPSKNPQFPNPVHRVQIVWVLNVNGANGKPLQYSEAPPLKMGEGSGKFKPTRLYEICSGVLGQAPPRPYDVEALLLGRSNELFIIQNGEVTTIAGFLPVPQGVVPPTAPTGFIRKINRPNTALPTAQAPRTQASPSQTQPVPAAAAVNFNQEEEIPF